MKRLQRGYTLMELLIVLGMVVIAAIAASMFGLIAWAIYRLITHFT